MSGDRIVSVVAEDGDNRSQQEIEKALIDKADPNKDVESENEEKVIINATETVAAKESESENEEKVEMPEINDEQVLGHLRKRFENESLTFDDLAKEREVRVEVPQELDEDVAIFNKYKKETGRGLSDFMMAQRDVENVAEDNLIHDYIKSQNPAFTDEDVKMKISLQLEIDEDIHDDTEVMERKLARKEMYGSAVKYFNEEKEKYKAPLEMRNSFIPEEERESYTRFQESQKSASARVETDNKKKDHFTRTTNELFSDEFKGFEFKVSEDKTLNFEVNNVQEVKDFQMKASNFIGTQLDENGMLKDAESYHKAMYAASNADKIAKFAYDQGRADALEEDAKAAKNIDMEARKKPEKTNPGGLTVTAVESDGSRTQSGNGLRIQER
jgi:hypothetical protein